MITEKTLARLAQKILKAEKIQDATMDIFLLPHAEMAALKWKLMKKKTEPNVLSFPEPGSFPHPETKKRRLGEILLNRDILKKSPERAAPLLVHGIVHLLGYDHEKKSDNGKMARRESRILDKLTYPSK
jgi:probable rRNA maturation factor